MAIIWIYPNQHTILWNNMELSKLRDHIWLHTPGYKCSPKIIVAVKHLWIWKASQKYLLQMLTKILLPMLTKINPANTHQNIPANAHHNIATNRSVQPYMVMAVMVHIIRPYMVGIWYGIFEIYSLLVSIWIWILCSV